jgi:hypothetical protein
VDGILTDDNDAFLYGAKTVFCELSANEKVLHHTMGRIEINVHPGTIYNIGTFNVCVFNEHNPATDRFDFRCTLLCLKGPH